MTKEELLKKLKEINEKYVHDEEMAHAYYDKALLEYIGDEEITKTFEGFPKWYA